MKIIISIFFVLVVALVSSAEFDSSATTGYEIKSRTKTPIANSELFELSKSFTEIDRLQVALWLGVQLGYGETATETASYATSELSRTLTRKEIKKIKIFIETNKAYAFSSRSTQKPGVAFIFLSHTQDRALTVIAP